MGNRPKCKSQNQKILDRNTGANPCDHRVGKHFSHETQKEWTFKKNLTDWNSLEF